jgi:uncharacterized damage-inducible protein DinB
MILVQLCSVVLHASVFSDLQTFLDYLASVHTRTRRVVGCIPAEGLEWVPAPGRWSAGDQVRHLAGIERWMYAETVAGRPSRYPGHGRELADGLPAVLAYYDRLHEEARAEFAALTAERWAGRTTTPAGVPITTWKWLRAMLEHEAHHRGQLYFTLGLLGVPTPPIYGLSEPELFARTSQQIVATDGGAAGRLTGA